MSSTDPSAPADLAINAPDAQSPPHPTPDPLAVPATRQNSTQFDTDTPIPSPSLPPTPSPLPPRQLTALTLLTAGKTTASVAHLLGVHRSTIHNWKHDPAFAAELTRRQAELAAASDARLRLLLLQATHTALASLHVRNTTRRHQNAFRLLTTLRPWMKSLQPPTPPTDHGQLTTDNGPMTPNP